MVVCRLRDDSILIRAALAIFPSCPYPQIFHGHDVELQEIVALLQQDSARIAVLGPGGMGKTSLAVAVLHHGDVEAKFANRFFIPCHSTACNDLVSSIASHVGVAQGPDLARQLIRHLSQAPLPALLVLDNFETPWESMFSRPDVEKFLALLTDIHNLALIVIMRGAERPKGVRWTRLFLRPLASLDDSAATETFFAIVDDVDNQSRVPELLHLTGNLPLAINLIAHVATYEGCDATLTRWNNESTRILSDSYDKKSNLDISIMLSLSSARMTPQAHDLASILSMLPDGLSDADLIHSHLPIENTLPAKATLIRISLAYIGRNERLCILVPIREHICATHPPSAALKFPLRQYFRDLVDLWKFKLVTSPDTVSKISVNLGNLNSLMEDGLREDAPDILATVARILMLNDFY
ncbi:hypothetical protein DFH08DRAFT_706053 [Mycena albidolilacea]|uniref:Novel STAND NTPase 1 domain-containing protein n=1 Tax=Mycena albidolilacea TaxID=1033008 RepID=A0AAD6ZSA4_9AGAR|nr:hypothetical protein DFH08DRAFT_706053 [Mycena albidolilacea]